MISAKQARDTTKGWVENDEYHSIEHLIYEAATWGKTRCRYWLLNGKKPSAEVIEKLNRLGYKVYFTMGEWYDTRRCTIMVIDWSKDNAT